MARLARIINNRHIIRLFFHSLGRRRIYLLPTLMLNIDNDGQEVFFQINLEIQFLCFGFGIGYTKLEHKKQERLL